MAKQPKPIEVGASVKWTRKNGLPAKGKVLRVETTSSGPWVCVTVVGQAEPSRVRPAVLRAK